MIVGLYGKPHHPSFRDTLETIVDWCGQHGHTALAETSLTAELEGSVETAGGPEIPDRSDVLIVLGGDGTMLSVARLAARHNCPILGINLGSLGFLTEVRLEDLEEALERLNSGDYQTEKRFLLKAVITREGFSTEAHLALNRM